MELGDFGAEGGDSEEQFSCVTSLLPVYGG